MQYIPKCFSVQRVDHFKSQIKFRQLTYSTSGLAKKKAIQTNSLSSRNIYYLRKPLLRWYKPTFMDIWAKGQLLSLLLSSNAVITYINSKSEVMKMTKMIRHILFSINLKLLTVMVCTNLKRLVSSHKNSVCSFVAMFQDLHFPNSSFFPLVFVATSFKPEQLCTSVMIIWQWWRNLVHDARDESIAKYKLIDH